MTIGLHYLEYLDPSILQTCLPKSLMFEAVSFAIFRPNVITFLE